MSLCSLVATHRLDPMVTTTSIDDDDEDYHHYDWMDDPHHFHHHHCVISAWSFSFFLHPPKYRSMGVPLRFEFPHCFPQPPSTAPLLHFRDGWTGERLTDAKFEGEANSNPPTRRARGSRRTRSCIPTAITQFQVPPPSWSDLCIYTYMCILVGVG